MGIIDEIKEEIYNQDLNRNLGNDSDDDGYEDA